MIEENQLISHLYQNRDNGQWMIQTNDEHQKGVADMATKERNGRHSSNTYAR